MKNRAFSILCVLVVVSTVLLMTMPVSAKGWEVTLRVGPGQEYETIQSAVDDARQGDTILVYPGFYEESVLVTTDHLEIIAESDGVTVFSPNGGTAAFTVFANHVTIRGFDELTGIEDCVPGIEFEGSHNTFAENVINPGSCPGVNAFVCRDPDGGSNFNRIENNTIVHGDLGIVMTSTSADALNIGNIIKNNTINDIWVAGICVQNGRGFNISGNTIPNAFDGHGITVIASNNTPQGKHRITNNIITNCAGYGIALWADNFTTLSNNRIYKNNVSLSGRGINLYADPEATVSHNLIQDNTIHNNNMSGIVLELGANDNRVFENLVETNHAQGIAVLGDNNRIIGNTALHNGVWDLADWGVGNKWSDNTYENANWE